MMQFSSQYGDLEIRILGRQERGYPVEMALDQELTFERGWLDPSFLPWLPSADPMADGERLSRWLFSDPNVRAGWDETRGRSPQRRIRLRIDDTAPELHAIPWEILLDLHDPKSPLVIAASEQTPFSRYLAVKAPRARPVTGAPLRVLLVIASPANLEDYRLEQIDVEKELALVREALGNPRAGYYSLYPLSAPVTPEALLAELRKGYNIVHIMAHTVNNEDRGAMFLAGDDNQVRVVEDDAFGSIFSRLSQQPNLVFLAGCETARRDTVDAMNGFAARLVQTGVPAVVAMQDRITIDSVHRFTQTFYSQLVKHGIVDLACNQARADLQVAQLPDAASPVLFMRLRDGRLLSEDFAPTPVPEESTAPDVQEQKEPAPPDSTPVDPPVETGGASAPYRPPAPGYISDAPDPRIADRLSIAQEVETIAHVLMSKRVKPPLSLGLFGDWGSGKSFFMAKLQDTIRSIADFYRSEEREQKEPSEWCTRVVQIEFNAWHYSDANLWANLVTRIYEELNSELSETQMTDKEMREKLEEGMRQAKGAVGEAESGLNQAKERVETAQSTFQAAQDNRRQKQNTLSGLIDNVQTLLKGRPEDREDELSQKLDSAAQALGYPEAAKSYAELQELNANLSSFSGRLAALSVNLVHAPWSLLVLTVLIIGLPVAIGLVLQQFGDQITLAGQRIVEISTLLVGLVAWLKIQVGHGLRLVGLVETSFREAQRVRDETMSSDPDVQRAHQELANAEIAEQAAASTLKNAQAELQRLQAELQELRPERRLFRLIEERSRTAAYSQHLGIISLIRTDFEQMSKLLVDMIDEERDLAEGRPPIQRIVLYIDDLDRCRPERVVEVLEAVHLLLAFPLFIVVVGVDPRWLRHSLAQHYTATLSEEDVPARLAGRGGSAFYSTPQEYLEKIFQIPFALRPVEKTGYEKLVSDLLQPLPAMQRRPHPAEALLIASVDKTVLPGTAPGVPPEHETEVPPDVTGEKKPTESFTQLSADQLDFRDWEEQDIYRLWPLFHTPRSVKRFINIYRLLRASLGPEQVGRFEGTEKHPGEYQVALLLLGVVTAFPNEATAFLCRLDSWLEAIPPEDADKPRDWQDVIAGVNAGPAPHSDTDRQGRSEEDAQAKEGGTKRSGATLEGPQAIRDDAAWEEMMNSLERVVSTGFTQSFQVAVLRAWARQTARYSFSIYPVSLMN